MSSKYFNANAIQCKYARSGTVIEHMPTRRPQSQDLLGLPGKSTSVPQASIVCSSFSGREIYRPPRRCTEITFGHWMHLANVGNSAEHLPSGSTRALVFSVGFNLCPILMKSISQTDNFSAATRPQLWILLAIMES